jgi:hypothetical protein
MSEITQSRRPVRLPTALEFGLAAIVLGGIGFSVWYGPLIEGPFHTVQIVRPERIDGNAVIIAELGARYVATIQTIKAPDTWQEALPAGDRGHALCEVLDYPILVRNSDGDEQLLAAGQILLLDDVPYDDGTASHSASGQILVRAPAAGAHFRCISYGGKRESAHQ